MTSRGWALVGALLAYAAACLILGVWSARHARAPRGYFMADRRLGPFLAAMAAFSSNFSGFAFVGGPGLIYARGVGSVWMLLGAPLSVLLVFGLLAKPLRLLAASRDALSVPAVLAARFGSESVRGLAAVAILVGTLGYLAVQFRAMGTLLLVLARGAGIPAPSLEAGILGAALVVVGYGTLGGMRASVATDALQGVLMVGGSLTVALVAASRPGGFSGAVAQVFADDPQALAPFGTDGALVGLSWYVLFTLGAAGQPHYVSKLMMLRRLADVRRVLPLTLASMLLASLLWVVVGLVVRADVASGAAAPLAAPDHAIGDFLARHVPPILAGLIAAAAFAAIMSSADSFLNVAAAAIAEDLPRASGRRAGGVREARAAALFAAVLALGLALVWNGLLGLLGSLAWGLLAATLTPLTLIGLNWKRPSARAAVAALVCGLGGVALTPVLGPYGIPAATGQSAALLLSLAVFLAISLGTPAPTLAPDVEAAMDA